jgi:hypothetical protein
MKLKYVFISCVALFMLAGCGRLSGEKTGFTKDSLTAIIESAVSSSGQSSTSQSSRESSTQPSSSATTTSSSEQTTSNDLSGNYVSSDGHNATVTKVSDNNWSIKYSTADGETSGTFTTNFKKSGTVSVSSSQMQKAGGYVFQLQATIKEDGSATLTMSNGVPSQEMTFTKKQAM